MLPIHADWSAETWRAYLQELARKEPFRPVPAGKVPRMELKEAPREDSRIYTQGIHYHWPFPKEWENNDIAQEMALVADRFTFRSSLSPVGGPYFVYGKKAERFFLAYDLPRRAEFASDALYAKATTLYLERIENIVKEGKRIPGVQLLL